MSQNVQPCVIPAYYLENFKKCHDRFMKARDELNSFNIENGTDRAAFDKLLKAYDDALNQCNIYAFQTMERALTDDF